jgi:ABC-type nitrate/sulfonate/bicarbonate transport system substrate-binding protein
VLAASHPAAALDAVSMRQMEISFSSPAITAHEQGFYRDAGLDVTSRGGPSIDAAEAVASNRAVSSAPPAFCVLGGRAAGWSCWPHLPASRPSSGRAPLA